MALITSISGIRGTIGGTPGTALTPPDLVKFTTAYAAWLKSRGTGNTVVIGRDARISGEAVRGIVVGTLQSCGLNVVDLGLSTTPTVEMAVPMEGAAGGIILTASHNPREWNALKLLNEKGEFLSAEDGEWVLRRAESVERSDGPTDFVDVMKLGNVRSTDEYGQRHIDAILSHPLVDVEAVRARGFKVVVDPVNSSGAIFVPQLLRALGVTEVTMINGEPNGHFAHNPEPLPENLRELCGAVTRSGADLGIAVDPDVDRLCFVNEDGSLFGEEYTLVAVADYILSRKAADGGSGGDTVSNLSSTRALRDVTEKWGGTHHGAAVGEVNVVEKMKAVGAAIGGEGNGGVIVPELHYGRDALAGIALFLTHLARFGKSISSLRRSYPDYHISKNKIELQDDIDIAGLFLKLAAKYRKQPINTDDGLKIEFDKDWVHLRPSNTEPIIRIYAESTSETTADNIAKKLMADMREAMLEAPEASATHIA